MSFYMKVAPGMRGFLCLESDIHGLLWLGWLVRPCRLYESHSEAPVLPCREGGFHRFVAAGLAAPAMPVRRTEEERLRKDRA